MKKIGLVLAGVILPLCMVMSLAITPTYADVEIQELSKVFDKFSIGGDFNLFYRFDENPFYGAEITAAQGSDTNWGETFSRLRFTAEKNIGWTTLEGQFVPYFGSTVSQDVYGLVNNASHVDIDQAWIKFGKAWSGQFDITIGQQDIKIEKWFVMADGDDQPVAKWLYFHTSFPMAIKLDGDHGPLKSTLFWAKAGTYAQNFTEGPEQDVQAGGLNLHYDFAEKMFVYGGIYKKDEKANATATENDTWAYDIGIDVSLAGLQLEGELVYETGDVIDTASGAKLDREAYAGFGAATYTFPVPMAPYVRATYIYYSGDGNAADNKVKEYDPLFYGFKQWNRWVIGELVGETQLPNYNKQDIIAEVGFMPIEPLTISLMYIQHKLVEKNWLGNPVNSTDWADEINLFADYPIGDHLFVSAGLGYTTPKDAAKEIFGDDESAFFGQLFFSFYF